VWVGIDGWSPGDDNLIQAGIDESLANPDTGQCSPGTFYVLPWYELLPADPTEVPITTVTVSPGDQVTVVIGQVSAGTWQIRLTDDTNGQSFSAQQPYNAPEASADWIVEASSSTACNGDVQQGSDVCNLAPFCMVSDGACSGPVNFTNILATGTEANWLDVFMTQNGSTVATPSTLSGNIFSVAYTGAQGSYNAAVGPSGQVLAAGPQPRAKSLLVPVWEH
jgi:hypothetical protein